MTKADTRDQIADDLARSDLTTQINQAINNAIRFYQERRFFFNETRLLTFATVAGTSTYTTSEDSDIPEFIEIDAVMLSDGSNTYELTPVTPAAIEAMLDSSASSGRPYCYSYYELSFRLYPIPDAAYTIRPIGLVRKAVPTDDDEEGNVWFVYAHELIRCRAKFLLATHVIIDQELAILSAGAEQQEYARLRRESTRRQGTRGIEPTQF